MKRFRVSLARFILRGTGCQIARHSELEAIIQGAIELKAYVEKSGGLNDPHRINSYRRVMAGASDIESRAVHLEANA